MFGKGNKNKKEDINVKEAKQKLIDAWESCFHKKVNEVLTEEGLECYWSDSTEVDEAAAMLTKGAILDFVHNVVEDKVGNADKVTCIMLDPENGEIEVFGRKLKRKEAKKSTPTYEYLIRRKAKGSRVATVYSQKFSTADEAYEFIEEEAKNSEFAIDDFEVVTKIKADKEEKDGEENN